MLPRRKDIEELISRVEDAHHRELQQVQALSDHLTVDETTTTALKQQVAALERDRYFEADAAVVLQLDLEDLEDRSHWNNLRLRGLPEDTGQENLTILDILHRVLDDTPPGNLELDRVHRVGS